MKDLIKSSLKKDLNSAYTPIENQFCLVLMGLALEILLALFTVYFTPVFWKILMVAVFSFNTIFLFRNIFKLNSMRRKVLLLGINDKLED